MKHILQLLFLLTVSAVCLGCQTSGGQKGTVESQDSTQITTETPSAPDTLRGFVGDGTSMNMIELVNAEATDTLLLELGDEVDRQATLEVGKEINIIARHEDDDSWTVLATFDAAE